MEGGRRSRYWVTFAGIAPFLVGWAAHGSNSLRNTLSLVQAIQRAGVDHSLGREILPKGSACEWSRLVWDLLGDYGPIIMAGYGGQRRVNVSPTILSFVTTTEEIEWRLLGQSPQLPPLPPRQDLPTDPDARGGKPLSISVVQVNIRGLEQVRDLARPAQ